MQDSLSIILTTNTLVDAHTNLSVQIQTFQSLQFGGFLFLELLFSIIVYFLYFLIRKKGIKQIILKIELATTILTSLIITLGFTI